MFSLNQAEDDPMNIRFGSLAAINDSMLIDNNNENQNVEIEVEVIEPKQYHS